MIKTALFVSEVMPLGGTSTFALNICSSVRGRGWTAVAAAISDAGELETQFESMGLPLLVPDPATVLHEERIEHLYQVCARFSPAAVIAALSAGSFEFLRFVPDGTVRIGMIQSDEEGFYELVDQFLPWLDAVACVSQEICRKMEMRMTGKRVPVFHQPYGVPMPADKQVKKSDGSLKVVYMGRVVEEQKRVSMMSRIVRSTLDEGIDIRWTIIGDGADLESMKRVFKDTDKVRFLGQIAYRDIQSELNHQDVYFLCSDYEGLPLSLLEAMGAGLVPVVSDLPSGISEVVSDENGIRVPVNDERGFVTALSRLCADRALVSTLAHNARVSVMNSHSTDAMARRWEAMLDSLLPTRVSITWPAKCRATAPLDMQDRFWFHSALRPIRRMGKKFRKMAGH